MREKSLTVIVSMFLFSLMLGILLITRALPPAYSPYSCDRIYLDPAAVTYDTEANLSCTTDFDVMLKIENVENLKGFEWKLWYNTTLLDGYTSEADIQVSYSFVAPVYVNGTWHCNYDNQGLIYGGVTLRTAITGDYDLIEFHFHITYAPPRGYYPPDELCVSCPLTLNETELVDTGGLIMDPASYDEESGYYEYCRPQIVPDAPVASFTWSPTYPYVCQEVTCTSTSTPNGGDLIAWLWEIVGAATNTTAMDEPVMKFHCDGEGYVNVTLTVWDTEGANATIMKQIYALTRERARLFVHPSVSTITKGETFQIGVIANNVFDLYSFEFKLGYNTTILDVIEVWVMWPDFCIINETAGIVWVNTSCPYPYPFSGNGTLAAITFTVTEWGSCVLDLHNTTLVDFYAIPIAHDALDGYVRARSAPTIDSHYPPINPTIEEGESQEFNITKSDLDGDPLTVTWLLNQSDTGETSDSYTYTANYESAGTYNVTVIVSDGLFQTSHQWTLTVTNVERDIAIINVIPSRNIVGEGYSIFINLTTANQGEHTETFNVTVYANTIAISTFTNITLTSGSSTSIIFTWNTTGVPYGNYTLTAVADMVPGETDIADNNHTDGLVLVTVVGDVNGDCEVSVADMVLIQNNFGESCAEFPQGDVNCDCSVSVADMVIIQNNFGASCQA